MNKYVGLAGWVFSIALGIILIFTQQCGHKVVNNASSKDTVKTGADKYFTKTIHDTIKYPVRVYVAFDGKPHTVHDTFYIQAKPIVITKIDTLKAIRDYITAKIYMDTIKGSDAVVALRDSIVMNKIAGRTYQFKNNREKLVVTPQATAKLKVYLGAGVGLAINLKSFSLAPGLLIQTPNDHLRPHVCLSPYSSFSTRYVSNNFQ